MNWLELQEFRGNASASEQLAFAVVALEILVAIGENYGEPFAPITPSQYDRSNVPSLEAIAVMDSLETRPDRELLELALEGNENAFRELYERLKTPIFRYAFYWTHSEAAAEELAQDVFILLLEEGHKYKRGRGEVSAFAFGIARNLVRSFHRRERIYQELPADQGLEQVSGGERGADGPPAELIRRQDVLRVRRAIASLPEHYRQVIVLCDLCELGYAEAASRLECAVGTIRSRLHRAHALLAKKLKQSAKPEMELPAAGPEECLI